MPNIYIKTNFKFTVIPSDKPQIVVDKINSASEDFIFKLETNIYDSEYDSDDTVAFRMTDYPPADGKISAEIVGEEVQITCDCIFKVSAKAIYADALLESDRVWSFNAIGVSSGIFEEVSKLLEGITLEKYNRKTSGNMYEKERYRINAMTSKKAKDLKQ